MTASYFHHCASCIVSGVNPLSYDAWARLVTKLAGGVAA